LTPTLELRGVAALISTPYSSTQMQNNSNNRRRRREVMSLECFNAMNSANDI